MGRSLTGLRRCSACKRELAKTEFYRRKEVDASGHVWRGLEHRCKACMRAKHARWVGDNRDCTREYDRKRNRQAPDRTRARNLKKCYGLAVADYEAMSAAQGGLCAICGNTERNPGRKNMPSPQRLSVDHDHQENRVRALLCSNCNRALGLLYDDPALMRRAADYVEHHRKLALVAS